MMSKEMMLLVKRSSLKVVLKLVKNLRILKDIKCPPSHRLVICNEQCYRVISCRWGRCNSPSSPPINKYTSKYYRYNPSCHMYVSIRSTSHNNTAVSSISRATRRRLNSILICIRMLTSTRVSTCLTLAISC